jgi:hypothetical protein
MSHAGVGARTAIERAVRAAPSVVDARKDRLLLRVSLVLHEEHCAGRPIFEVVDGAARLGLARACSGALGRSSGSALAGSADLP